jgi:hypothetical protein
MRQLVDRRSLRRKILLRIISTTFNEQVGKGGLPPLVYPFAPRVQIAEAGGGKPPFLTCSFQVSYCYLVIRKRGDSAVCFVMFRVDSWIVFSYVDKKCFPNQSLAVEPSNNKTLPVVNAEIVKAYCLTTGC